MKNNVNLNGYVSIVIALVGVLGVIFPKESLLNIAIQFVIPIVLIIFLYFMNHSVLAIRFFPILSLVSIIVHFNEPQKIYDEISALNLVCGVFYTIMFFLFIDKKRTLLTS